MSVSKLFSHTMREHFIKATVVKNVKLTESPLLQQKVNLPN